MDSRRALHLSMHNFIPVSQKWKNAKIIRVQKRKGDKAECGNSCGISVPSLQVKVWSK